MNFKKLAPYGTDGRLLITANLPVASPHYKWGGYSL